ncbi:uncharacterized protein [Diadema antillarum]|uniref:uncharacterized protein n=1 Tax=Diadema antillarum TaxID=105358 RepID=UPI003A85A387
MAGLVRSPWQCTLLAFVIVCTTSYVVQAATMECHSIVRAGHRCRWPDEGFECHCIPNAECSLGTNACRCLPGYTGPNCERSCPYDRNNQCLTSCTDGPFYQNLPSYQQDSGVCLCKDGYTGKYCHLCDHNVWPNCTLCPHQTCENNGKCDLWRGGCACEDGYQGSYCSLCYPSLHPTGCGEHCDLTCVNSYCNTHTGACECPRGFDMTKNCSLCDPTRVSDGCMRFCRTICRAGGLCNVEQERCMCKDGYIGDDCRLCDPRVHPTGCSDHCSMHCHNNGYCDVLTGLCLCQPGYEVTYNCELCRPSLHSEACLNHCNPTCRNGGDCLSSLGFCICPIGYIQHDCSVCIPWQQARNCTDHCPPCENKATCNTITGECSCTAGWQGVACSDPCPVGTFGQGCQPCDCGNHPCDVRTGACLIQTTTPVPTTTTLPTTASQIITTVATTVAATTRPITTTPVATTTASVTTSLPTAEPANVVDVSSTEGKEGTTTSAGAGMVRTQQSPEEIASLGPGLILESRQNFPSSYVIAIVVSTIILIILLCLLILYLVKDRRKRKRQLPDNGPEEFPLNNTVTNNLENNRSSNIYMDSVHPLLADGEEPVDGACDNRRSLSEEQVQRLSRISGDLAFFVKVPNAMAANKVPNPNVFNEIPGSKDKFSDVAGTDVAKPNNNDPDAICKPGSSAAGQDDCGSSKKGCEGGDGDGEDMLGACGGIDSMPGPGATSTPIRPKSADGRVYEEVILPNLGARDPTEIRNPRMSGEYYLLEPTSTWGGSGHSSEVETDPSKAFQEDRLSQGTNPRVSADSGIEQAAAPILSPHYEQLERPFDLVQQRSPTQSKSERSDDERDSGVYAHLSRGQSGKGYNRLEFSPRRQRKALDMDVYSDNPYGRLQGSRSDDSQSD